MIVHEKKIIDFEVLVVYIALLGLTIWGLRVSNEVQQPQKTSDAFLRYVRANDIQEAQKLTSEPFKQANLEFDSLAKNIQSRVKKDPVIKNYRTMRTEEGAYVASVEYEISDSNDIPLIVKLIKENDNWRILTINDLP